MIGVFLNQKATNATKYIYAGLQSLKHRGQYGAGIAYCSEKKIHQHKNIGNATKTVCEPTKSNVAIAKTMQYTKNLQLEDVQPFVSHFKLGSIAVAFSGGLENEAELRDSLQNGNCAFTSFSQAEIIVHLIAKSYKKGFERAVSDAVTALKGSFTLLVMTDDLLIAARDEQGVEPLSLGKIENGWMLSSETCAIDSCRGEVVRDIKAGEIVIISEDGIFSFDFADKKEPAICSYEYVYYARPDSCIDSIFVYEARSKLGATLARESPVTADIVVGVPDSGLWAAMGYAQASHIPYTMGIIKNSYSGRTSEFNSNDFYMGDFFTHEEQRKFAPFNVLKNNVWGKRVVLVDDSIISGKTARNLIAMLKNAGATEVHLRIASPLVVSNCKFTPNLPMMSNLISAENTIDDIQHTIGANSLSFLSRQGMLTALHSLQLSSLGFCTSCFNAI
ncbi:MAG: phosphoribosyltransferase family protein [Treponemataceae bacterium]